MSDQAYARCRAMFKILLPVGAVAAITWALYGSWQDTRIELHRRDAVNAVLEAILFTDSERGFAIIDEDNVVVEWNRGMEQITGWTSSEMIGEPISKVMTREAWEAHGQSYDAFMGAEELPSETRVVKCVITPKGQTEPVELRINIRAYDTRLGRFGTANVEPLDIVKVVNAIPKGA